MAKDSKRIDVLAPDFEVYKGDKPYIFVSYSHKDKVYVYPEIERLHRFGYRIWYDEGIVPGTEFPRELQNAIEGSSYFLVFISKNAVKSKNVRNEINFALKREKNFLPIYIEDTQLDEGLDLQMITIKEIKKYELSQKQYIQRIIKVLPDELFIESDKKDYTGKEKEYDLDEKTIDAFPSKKRKEKADSYKVYITFKNLDDEGEPTPDSALAKDVFKFLSKKGVRVFHHIISLEDFKISEWKKVIDEAQKSSLVMVVVGTSLENLISEKVRDEWERFYRPIVDGSKADRHIFTYVDGVDRSDLPPPLLQNEPLIHGTGSLEHLYQLVSKATGIKIEDYTEEIEMDEIIKDGLTLSLCRIGGDISEKFSISPGEVLTVGRKNDNDIVLNPRQVSRNHAEIIYEESGLFVKDRKSRNGTFVNGRKISFKKLNLNDVIRFDCISFRVSLYSDDKVHWNVQEV
jgi:hypothetical protein